MKKRRRTGKRLLIGLPLLVVVVWWVENFRGSHEWGEAQVRAAKLGVSLRLSDYAASPLPDSESLLKDPVFAREWNRDVEPHLGRWSAMDLDVPNPRGIRRRQGGLIHYLEVFPEETDPERAVARLTEAAGGIEQRLNPFTEIILSFPVRDLTRRYDSLLEGVGATSEVTKLNGFVTALQDQALLALHRGEADLALRNCRAIDRLARSFSAPDLVHHLVAESFGKVVQTIIIDGIRLQAWEMGHLADLSEILSEGLKKKQLIGAFSYEAALVPSSIEDARAIRGKISDVITEAFDLPPDEPPSLRVRLQEWIHFDGPRGWEQRRKALVLNSILDLIESVNEWEWKRVDPVVIDMDEASEERFSFDPLAEVRDAGRTYSNSISAAIKHASRARLCQLAIHLEMFRLEHGDYPLTIMDLPKEHQLADPADPRERVFGFNHLSEGGFRVDSLFFKEQFPDSEFDQVFWEIPGR